LKRFNEQKTEFITLTQTLNEKYGYEAVTLNIEDSYYNMADKIKPRMDIIDKAKKAIENVGLTPFSSPIRGGTDGARLTYEGLLCPNLGTGGYQFHGRYEFASIQQMEKAVKVILELIQMP
jgi:tripeptide aminopeptidase